MRRAAVLSLVFASTAAAQTPLRDDVLTPPPSQPEEQPLPASPPPAAPPSTPARDSDSVPVPVPPRKRWRGEMGATIGDVFTGQRNAPVGTIGGAAFLTRLEDDPEVPLGLLTFRQHPSTVWLNAGETVGGQRARLGAEIFPAKDLGFTAGFGLAWNILAQVPELSGNAGLAWYLNETVRIDAGYSGIHSLDPARTTAFDGLNAAFTLLFGPLAIEAAVVAGLNAPVALPHFSVTGFVGRRWAVGVGIDGLWRAANAVLPTITAQSFTGGVALFPTNALRISAAWRTTLHQPTTLEAVFPTVPFDETAPLVHALQVSAALRM